MGKRSCLSAGLTSVLMIPMAWGVQGSQVYVGTTLDFTPANTNYGTTINWTMPTSSWNYDSQYLTQFTTDVYTYNNNMINQWQQIRPYEAESGFAGVGGIVWHFKSTVSTPMQVILDITYYWGNWGGHSFEVYFSDDNTWDDLDNMVGGTWDGGTAWTGYETNPLWILEYTNRLWGADGVHTMSLPVTTNDGEFWVRIDMSCTDGGASFAAMMSLGVTGTVAPASPTFSPSGPEISGPTDVTITCDQGASIYYTTNGDTPATSGTAYSSGVTVSVDNGTTLKGLRC